MDSDFSANSPNERADLTRSLVRFAIRETMGVVMMGVLLFLPAGKLDWGMGWALLVIMLVWIIGTAVVAVRRSPGLLIERTGPQKGSKSWDMTIMGIVGLTTVARCIVAGLDERNGWTTVIPGWMEWTALFVACLAYALVVWATASNPFFSQIVRIQEERGHTVATGGPYRYVRHPGYVGTLLFELASPVMLGSMWALIPGVIATGLLILRTALEDRTLRQELAGYEEYTAQVRFRLLPGVW